MTRDVHDALASHASEYDVRRELHAVPPHAVYEVVVNGTRAVCKLARGPEADPATEARILQHVDRETPVPVPTIFAVGDDYFVARWHDGVPGGPNGEPDDPTIDTDAARAMGAGLAPLHDSTAFESPGLFDSDADGLVLDEFESWAETLCARLAACREFLEPYGYADVASDVIRFLRDRPGVLGRPSDAVLVHGNYLLEHVGVSGDGIACVIDFEHALAGSPEYDYWSTVVPTFQNPKRTVPDGTLDAFRDGYESVRSLPADFEHRAAVYRIVLTVTYLRSLYCQRQWDSRADADRRADYYAEYVRTELATVRRRFE